MEPYATLAVILCAFVIYTLALWIPVRAKRESTTSTATPRRADWELAEIHQWWMGTEGSPLIHLDELERRIDRWLAHYEPGSEPDRPAEASLAVYEGSGYWLTPAGLRPPFDAIKIKDLANGTTVWLDVRRP